MTYKQKIYQCISCLFVLCLSSFTHATTEDNKQLINLELAELFDIEIISATKKKQPISTTPAAISVITAEDIKRSGALHIAEALRMASGLLVVQRNSHDWFVSARGSLNSSYVNKLLVLVDGRSVYNPQLARTYWNNLNVYLDDIERIEVIKGSGGAVWGANAVNGVVNIITKSSHDTHENAVKVGKGNLFDHILSVRHGGALTIHTSYRVYAQKQENRKTKTLMRPDSSYLDQAGFRLDSHFDANNEWTIQGGVSHQKADDLSMQTHVPSSLETTTHYLSARWQHTFSKNNIFNVNAYYNYEDRAISIIDYKNYIFDIEANHQFQLSENQEIIWGIGYRGVHSGTGKSSLVKPIELNRTDHLFSAFIQDDIKVRENLHLILGTKIEHNTYTGIEIQPSMRLAWTPKKHQTLWAAVSRSVHTPSQINDNMDAVMSVPPAFNSYAPLQMQLNLTGNPELKSESVVSYELGIRHPITTNMLWDTSFFYSDYKDLIIFELPPHIDIQRGLITLLGAQLNGMKGYIIGGESSLQWRKGKWQFRANYSYLNVRLDLDPSIISDAKEAETENPEHQFSLFASVDITPHLQAGMNLYHVSHLPEKGVDEYTNVDLHLLWDINKNISLSVMGKNLFDKQKKEFYSHIYDPLVTEIPRSIYTELNWRF